MCRWKGKAAMGKETKMKFPLKDSPFRVPGQSVGEQIERVFDAEVRLMLPSSLTKYIYGGCYGKSANIDNQRWQSGRMGITGCVTSNPFPAYCNRVQYSLLFTDLV